MIIKLAFAFGAGFISFLTPCVLPIIPGYISDVIGCFLLVGFFQNFIFKYLLNLVFPVAFSKKDSTMKNDDIIEGEFYDLHNDKSNISKK